MTYRPRTQLSFSEYDLMMLRSGFLMPGDQRYLELGERIPVSRLKPALIRFSQFAARELRLLANWIEIKAPTPQAG